jgi:hypothetical protein
VLPSGTKIDVRVNEALSSETSQQGDRFTGTVDADVTDPNSGRTLIPRGAEVSGRVLSASPSGRLSDSGELQLSINTIRVGSSMLNVTVQPFVDQGESHTKSNTTKVGGGAALGAIIGAIAGGGKGAAIGAGVGGAAGAGAAAATGKRPAEIKPEALITFETATETRVPATVGAQASSRSNPYPSTSSTQSSSPATTQNNPPSEPFPSSTADDQPPVLQRRGGGAVNPETSTSSSNTATAPSTNSNTASPTGGYGSPTAPGTSSTTTAINGTANTVPQTSYPAASTGTATNASSQVLNGRSFSARDRRVINNCVREHSSTLPDAALHKSATSRTFVKNDTIPADTNRLLRALPLQCDSQLPVLSNDLERVIYGGQVMLIDSSGRVLDVFALTP